VHEGVALVFETLAVPFEFVVFLCNADEFGIHSLGIGCIIHRTRHAY
jgi:hypothetical protein